LAAIKAWVANGLVTIIKIVICNVVSAAGALGDVIASEFNMNSTGPCALGLVGTNESGNLVNN
jgi:hypothetical protein